MIPQNLVSHTDAGKTDINGNVSVETAYIFLTSLIQWSKVQHRIRLD
jgi:hypothetical protein